jgi:pyrroline-5-carboxylate reductase
MNEKGVKEALDEKLLISIVAGVKIAQIKSWLLPSTRVLRAMPNTPCKVNQFPTHLGDESQLWGFLKQIREGMTVVSTIPSSNPELDHQIVSTIFSSIGRCRFLDEKHFDACTALSGAGPAFACIFLEAMADGGVMMGVPRREALELAAQSEPPTIICLGLFSNNCFP